MRVTPSSHFESWDKTGLRGHARSSAPPLPQPDRPQSQTTLPPVMAAIPAQMSSTDAPTPPPLPFSEVARGSRCPAPRLTAVRLVLFPEIAHTVMLRHAQSQRQVRKTRECGPSILLNSKLPALQ